MTLLTQSDLASIADKIHDFIANSLRLRQNQQTPLISQHYADWPEIQGLFGKQVTMDTLRSADIQYLYSVRRYIRASPSPKKVEMLVGIEQVFRNRASAFHVSMEKEGGLPEVGKTVTQHFYSLSTMQVRPHINQDVINAWNASRHLFCLTEGTLSAILRALAVENCSHISNCLIEVRRFLGEHAGNDHSLSRACAGVDEVLRSLAVEVKDKVSAADREHSFKI